MPHIDGMKSEIIKYQALVKSIKPLDLRKDAKGKDTFALSDWWRCNSGELPHFAFVLRREKRQPWRGTVCGRGLLAGTRGRPTATRRRPRMASGVGSLQYPYHITRTYCSLARAPHTHPLIFVTAVSHMRAGPVVSATSWSSKQEEGEQGGLLKANVVCEEDPECV